MPQKDKNRQFLNVRDLTAQALTADSRHQLHLPVWLLQLRTWRAEAFFPHLTLDDWDAPSNCRPFYRDEEIMSVPQRCHMSGHVLTVPKYKSHCAKQVSLCQTSLTVPKYKSNCAKIQVSLCQNKGPLRPGHGNSASGRHPVLVLRELRGLRGQSAS